MELKNMKERTNAPIEDEDCCLVSGGALIAQIEKEEPLGDGENCTTGKFIKL